MFNLLLFTLAVPIFGDYQINDKTNVDYLLTYSGNKMFSTGKDSLYYIGNNNSLDICKDNCAFNEDCLGIYEENEQCWELNNLGEPVESDVDSYSYTKISYHNLKTNEHSLTGEIWDTNDLDNFMNTTVYLDINHNGVLDEGEKYINTLTNREFTFNNLSEGVYLVRQVLPDGCIQLYPGLNSSFGVHQGDGYVDKVTRYVHHGHHTYGYPFGCFIDEHEEKHNETKLEHMNKNFSMILGDNNNTFLTFHTNYSITLSFIDESVIDNPGEDIFIDIFEHSNLTANVSVSSDDETYKLLGILNTNMATHKENDANIMRQSFDLKDHNNPIVYIKLDFIGGKRNDIMNIIRVGVYKRSLYLPPYGFMVRVPLKKWLFFYNDCHYYFSCYTHCALNFYYIDEYVSCMKGCELFYEKKNCNCLEYNQSNSVFEYDDAYYYYDDDYYTDDIMGDGELDVRKCDFGCDYSMRQYVYPNYTVIKDNNGLLENRIDYQNETELDSLLQNCDEQRDCASVSLDINGEGNLYNSYKHIHNHNYSFLKKNNYYTTTQTVTITSNTETSTSQTETSTSQTVTSTSQTETSTSNTETGTSQTETSTSQTETSTSQTETSQTETSTSQTETSTSQTETSTSQTETSQTETSKTELRRKIYSSLRNNTRKSLKVIYVIISVIIISLVGLGFMITIKNRLTGPAGVIETSIPILSYDNPLYEDKQYNQDVNPEENYLEIGEDNSDV